MRTSSQRTIRRAFAVAAGAVLLGVLAPPAGAVTGQLRALFVLATWGPRPFTVAETQRVLEETNAFFRASSAGRFSMPGSVADWITLDRSVFDSCSATELRAESPATLLAGYDRVAFITPRVPQCQFAGEADPTEVLLNGVLTRPLAAHELGHTLGLGHSSSLLCEGRTCRVEEYGGMFSTMGGGTGDFNAFEKNTLGWLTSVVRPDRSGTHELGPVEGPTSAAQALVVTTARSEFWFESRSIPVQPFQPGLPQPPGVVVIAGPASGESPYPNENLVLPNPNGGGRYGYLAGESFTDAEPSASRSRAIRLPAPRSGSSGSIACRRHVRACGRVRSGAGESASSGTTRWSAAGVSPRTRCSWTAGSSGSSSRSRTPRRSASAGVCIGSASPRSTVPGIAVQPRPSAYV